MEQDRTLEPYEAPTVEELGSIADLTAESNIGPNDDGGPFTTPFHHSA